MGRPSKYNDKLATQICRRIAAGESLRSVCREGKMPHLATVLRWLLESDKPEFHDQYARAREMQAELMADELQEIADSVNGDVQRDRLRVDTRKWIASKLLPKKYGERQQMEVTGRDGGPIQHQRIERVIVDPAD